MIKSKEVRIFEIKPIELDFCVHVSLALKRTMYNFKISLSPAFTYTIREKYLFLFKYFSVSRYLKPYFDICVLIKVHYKKGFILMVQLFAGPMEEQNLSDWFFIVH